MVVLETLMSDEFGWRKNVRLASVLGVRTHEPLLHHHQQRKQLSTPLNMIHPID